MQNKHVILLFALSFFLLACIDSTKNEQLVLAQVGTVQLFQKDLKKVLGEDLNSEDLGVKVYVHNWVRNQVVLQAAAEVLSSEEQDFEEELQVYKNSLIRYSYESSLVSSALDTSISQKELKGYYNENSKNFELKENVVKCRFVFLPKGSKAYGERKEMFNYEDSLGKVNFFEWVSEHDLEAHVFDSAYVNWEKVKNILPFKPYNDENFISNNSYREYWQEDGLWLVKVMEFQLKDNISPLEMVAKEIRAILLNKRKLALVKKNEQELYEKAMENGQIKLFLKDQ